VKCSVCGTENSENNKFCSSCGKPLPKPQSVTNNLPAGTGQTPVPAAHQGSGLGIVLLGGGALFLIAVVVVGLFVLLPMSEEKTPSWEEPGILSASDLTTSGDSGQAVDSSGSSLVATTATMRGSPPVHDSSSTSSADLIIGTWQIQSSAMHMQFSADGAATLLDPTSKEYATGSWEKISDGKYRLRSPLGTEYPVLLLDPIAGTMYFEDYSMVFTEKG
jgi:hypothetical protein